MDTSWSNNGRCSSGVSIARSAHGHRAITLVNFIHLEADLHCRRFLDGIIHIPVTGAVPPYLMKMTFRNKWA